MSDWVIGILSGAGVVAVAAGVLLVIALRRTEARAQRLAQRARAAERMAELGMLTGGLAHEIKNPLSSVGLNIQLVEEDLSALAHDGALPGDKVARIQRRVSALARETQRLRDILDDFLRFAGRMKLDLVPVDVNQLVRDVADFFLPQAQAAGVRVRSELAASPAAISADPALLKQALLNLIINATQAMSAPPTPNALASDSMAIGTGTSSPAPPAAPKELILRTRRQRSDGRDYLVIDVIDTGPGIPADVLPKIFQPYFSTKRGGTGLGLPTTRRIVEEHGGTLQVDTEPGRGTDFSIHLPVVHAAAGVPAGR